MPAMTPSQRASRCRGPQPVRGTADPDASMAEKKACETKGLYGILQPSREPSAATGGLAQAFHSSAGIWLTEETASRVISDESIDSSRWPSHKIVQCSADFKVHPSGPEPFKDHLIGISGRTRPLLGRAYRPGQERQAEDMPRDPWGRCRQIVDPIGDKMGLCAQGMFQVPHALALAWWCFRPIGFRVVALGDDAARQFRQHLAKR